MKPLLNNTIRAVYKYVPFKKEVFSVLKKIWLPPESVYKHLHFTGIIDVPIDENCSFKMRHYGYQIENEVFWNGLCGKWEKESLNTWIKLCKQSSVILDIGANTGIYSLIAKSLNPESSVYAFEPVKRVYQKLKNNNELNNYNIICLDSAVSDYDGEGIFYDTESEHTYSVTINKKLNPDSSIETTVRTITLDSFIEQYNIPKVDLIKIDVESHEAEVLSGFKRYLASFKPTILIEILFEEVGINVHELVKDLGYIYYHIDEEKGLKQTDKLTPVKTHHNYLLCTRNISAKLNLIKLSN